MEKPLLATMNVLSIVSIIFGMVLFGESLAQSYPLSVSQLIANAKKQIKTVDMATLKSAFDNNDLGLIVDVREPEEYANGYFPGAVNIPRGVIEMRIWTYVGYPDKIDMSKKMTLYCNSGARCALAAKSLHDLGFSNVTAAGDMGMGDWAKAGYPLVKK
jgi:rhodanese-related sulfurtransferase